MMISREKISKPLVLLVAILLCFSVLCISTVQSQQVIDPNCPVTEYRPSSEVDKAVSDIDRQPFEKERFQRLTFWLEETENANLPFTSKQIIAFLDVFPFVAEKLKVVEQMQPWLVGMTAEDIRDVLDSIPFSSDRFVVLGGIMDLLFNASLENKKIVASAFSMSSDREKALQMMENLVPRNCFFGGIRERVVNFVIDVSGSMDTKVPGKPETRLDVTKRELMSAIGEMLKPYQMFNIEPFSNGASLWSPSGPVNATREYVDKALPYVKQLKAGGGTNTLNALHVSFQQPFLIAIYLLSDGEPTDAQPDHIISKVVQWNDERTANGLKAIKVHSILFMPGVPEKDKAKEIAFMKGIAMATGGVYKNIEGHSS